MVEVRALIRNCSSYLQLMALVCCGEIYEDVDFSKVLVDENGAEEPEAKCFYDRFYKVCSIQLLLLWSWTDDDN